MDAASLIRRFEGLRLEAYRDAGGIWTVGYGSTGPGIKDGLRWTLGEAEHRLQHDINQIQEALPKLVKVPLTEGQIAALTSFIYNVGIANFAHSSVLRLLNQKNYQGAADHLLLWNKVGAYVNHGLNVRRSEERKVFLG